MSDWTKETCERCVYQKGGSCLRYPPSWFGPDNDDSVYPAVKGYKSDEFYFACAEFKDNGKPRDPNHCERCRSQIAGGLRLCPTCEPKEYLVGGNKKPGEAGLGSYDHE